MTVAPSTAVVRLRPIIRVFVSSTFSDLVAERNVLANHVWPDLERYCRQRGFTFQAIDLRWGVPSEAALDHRTMQICLEELRRAQETSPEPNFLILLGNKYGWRPLPETISQAEFDRLHEYAGSKTEQDILATWYRRDTNAEPPAFLLRARTDSPDGQDYTKTPDAEGRLHDSPAWLAVQDVLWSIVNEAYPAAQLAGRFAMADSAVPSIVRFQGSATEQEIWHGALRVANARDHVVACFRNLDRSGGDPVPSQLKLFIDLREDKTPDTDAFDALEQLKLQLTNTLGAERIIPSDCRWALNQNGQPTGAVTTDHLVQMCDAILARLQAIILRQINDYWGADLSADDASVVKLRGSQRELDLELRDHLRFAEERGPVELFVGRDEQVRGIREYLQTTANRPLIVHGPSGSGKTALLAYVAQQPIGKGTQRDTVRPVILTRFIGAHPESSTLRGLMTSLCRELRLHFPVTTEQQPDGPEQTETAPLPDTLHKLIEEFYNQLGHATPERPIYIFLDALDQLDAADAAPDVDWVRSPLVRLADQTMPCHARLVASCLSPSTEFPRESQACQPFRRLQSRALLVEQELGALSEPAARQIVRSWLATVQRGLTEDQWKLVDDAIHSSSQCRQPLYLKVLFEQIRGWRAFDPPAAIPLDLPQLLQQSLLRLCAPNQHADLPRIALGYLVCARYGLSEGELLEVLFRDPEIQAQLKKSNQDYGHMLPPDATRLPIAPWARLRSDLRPYLSERAAPGTSVLYCYHRQVEQAVRTLFLKDEAVHNDRLRRLAIYFDGRWDQPDAHALMELPDLLLALPDHQRLYDRLTNFAFPMCKAEVGLLDSIASDYHLLADEGPSNLRQRLSVWEDFFREQGHILRRGLDDGSTNKILLQLAVEHADDSPLTQAAERWLADDRGNWFRLQRVNRPAQLTINPCRLVLEGHTELIMGALEMRDGSILSWSWDNTLRLWDGATGVCRAELKGHTDLVSALSLPDGEILTWSQDATLRLWDGATGACRVVLEGHSDWVLGALSLPDGRILSWSDDNTLRLWDAATGACRGVLEGDVLGVLGALALPEDRILSWSKYGTLRLWDAVSGTCRVFLTRHSGSVNGALSLPDGGILSWSEDNTLRLWDTVTGACRAVLKGHTGRVTGALPLSDGRLLSWSWDDHTLRLWDAATVACIAVLKGHTDKIQGALALPDGRILSWSRDKTLRLWDGATGVCRAVLEGHSNWVQGAMSLPGGRIVSWSGDELRVWDAATGIGRAVLEGPSGALRGALSLSDGRVLSWSQDNTLRVWDYATGGCRAVLQRHTHGRICALSLPDGQILSYSLDKTLRVWDAATGDCRVVLEGHTESVNGALSLPDGGILSWSEDKTLRLWDPATGARRAVLKGHTKVVNGALLLPDSRILSWSEDSSLQLWDAATGDCRVVLEGHTESVNGALSLPAGRILSWSDDCTLRLWDAATGACLHVLEEHSEEDSSEVKGALVLPDGRILTWEETGIGYFTLRLWDAATGSCRAVLDGHTDEVIDALLLPAGWLLSWSKDTTLRLWDATTGVCRAVLEGHTSWVDGAMSLPDGRILSWSWDELRMWDAATGACLEVVPEQEAANRRPDWLHARRAAEQPASVAGPFFGTETGRTGSLRHQSVSATMSSWQAESNARAPRLLPDGTLVVKQANGEVCILKLHHGRRRVSLGEAEEILIAQGMIPPDSPA